MSKSIAAMNAMWQFASTMVEKHGMNGDDTMTDEEHQQWQEAAGLCHEAINEASKAAKTNRPATTE